MAWIMLKAHVKANAFSQKQPNRAYRILPASSAYQWRVEREDVEAMETAATLSGKLTIEDGIWEVTDRLIFQSARTAERFVRQTPTNTDKRSQIAPETETETINTKAIKSPAVLEFPPNLNNACFSESWGSWLAYRRQEKLSIKTLTLEAQLRKLSKFPDPCGSIGQSIDNGWHGLFPIKGQPQSKPSANHLPNVRDLDPVT